MQNNVPGAGGRRRRFAVTVDGVRHEVIVEELEHSFTEPNDADPNSTSPRATPETAASHSDTNVSVVDGWVSAPMPGTVTELSVQVGDEVQAGDVLLILTAMKLENEIIAPTAGTVRTISIAQGDNVNSGDALIQLDTEGSAR